MSHDPNSQSKLLFAVEETFDIDGRGLVVASGPQTRLGVHSSFQNGAPVCLKRPDGTIIENTAYLEIYSPNKRKIFALSLPGLTVADVPRGTEVWATKVESARLDESIPAVFEVNHTTRVQFLGKVLIAESDTRLRRRIADLLGASTVHSCSSGKDALYALSQSDMDVVLLDVKLPDISGVDVLERYRRLGGRAVVVLLNERNATVVHGAGEQMQVPFDITDLVAKVSALLKN
jgi:CheY-like chemotaxis protein